MCDQSLINIEEAIKQIEQITPATATEEDLLNLSTSTASAITLGCLLTSTEADDNRSDSDQETYKSATSSLFEPTKHANEIGHHVSPSSPGYSEQLSPSQPSVESMLQQAVESIDQFVLKQYRSLPKRRHRPTSIKGRHTAGQNGSLDKFDTDPVTGHWYGFRNLHRKKIEKASLIRLRKVRCVLHSTQQSLKHFNIHRKTYNIK